MYQECRICCDCFAISPIASTKWEGMARLIFTLAQRDVNFRWNGLRDYGYIRLCCKWIDGNGLTTVTADAADAMMRDILPADMCSALDDELAALEIL